MATGRETKEYIIEKMKQFVDENACEPREVEIPMLMALDLGKCTHDELGSLSGKFSEVGVKSLRTRVYSA